MQYLGGKSRLAREIVPFLEGVLDLTGGRLIEPFVGGFNIVPRLHPGRDALCSDLHPGLITLYRHLQLGWEPPEELSEDRWRALKAERNWSNPLTAFAAFGCSFGGQEFTGYARNATGKSYPAAARRSLLRKARDMPLERVQFEHLDYIEVPLDLGDVVYADPPYANTTGYSTGRFDHETFWRWCEYAARRCSAVFVSEFTPPDRPGWEVVWQKERNVMVDGKTQGGNRRRRIDLLLRCCAPAAPR